MKRYLLETVTDAATLTKYAVNLARTEQIVAITRDAGIIMLLCDVSQDEVDAILASLNDGEKLSLMRDSYGMSASLKWEPVLQNNGYYTIRRQGAAKNEADITDVDMSDQVRITVTNAKLMSAAPDLLQALLLALPYLKGCHADGISIELLAKCALMKASV